jgi:membrane protease YdiL (CAAX protease family)
MIPAARGREPETGTMSALGAALWATALFALVRIFIGVTDAVRPGATLDVVNLTACEVLATSVVLFAIARIYAPQSSLRSAFGIRRVGATHLVLSAIAGAGLNPLASTLDERILRRWPYDDPAMTEAMEKLVAHSPPAVLLVAGLVVMPIACELFFRGALFTQLARAVPVDRVVISSAIFFACSLEWRSMPSGLILGLALGWMRARSGSVVAAIVARLAFSAVQMLPLLQGRDATEDIVYSTVWVVAGAAIAVAALAAMGLRAKEKAPARPAVED